MFLGKAAFDFFFSFLHRQLDIIYVLTVVKEEKKTLYGI